jgi:hypothetical protein
MADDLLLVDQSYRQHLSDQDLRLLAADVPDLIAAGDPAVVIRSRPGLLQHLIGRPTAFSRIFQPSEERFLAPASPFLVFAVALCRAEQELSTSSYVDEWFGPHHRMPVFEVEPLRELLADPWRRLLLTEVLASFTKVASGSVLVATRRGVRRQRFSELDPVGLAGLLGVTPETEHPGIYRRLGDVALFLTGVFPDHTATHGFSRVDESRLLRASRLHQRPENPSPTAGFGDAHAVELLEQLGRRWYQLAHQLIPPPVSTTLRAVGALAENFTAARRVLNFLTDRFLFPYRSQWFGMTAES